MTTVKPMPASYDQPPPYFQDGQGAGPYPPGPGWIPPPHGQQQQQQQQQQHQQYPPMYPGPAPVQGATVIVQPVRNPGIVFVGGCPRCGGMLEDSFGICALVLAFLFFPIGVLCCLAMREKRCINCGTRY